MRSHSKNRQTNKSGGNAGDHVTIGFCLGSHWFRIWREFSGLITELGKAPANNSGLHLTLNWKCLCTWFFLRWSIWSCLIFIAVKLCTDAPCLLQSTIARERTLVGAATRAMKPACFQLVGWVKERSPSYTSRAHETRGLCYSCRCSNVSFSRRLGLKSVHFLIGLKSKRLQQTMNQYSGLSWIPFSGEHWL